MINATLLQSCFAFQVHLIAAPRCVVIEGLRGNRPARVTSVQTLCQPITSPRMELRSAVAMRTARLLSQPPSPPGARPNILWQRNERVHSRRGLEQAPAGSRVRARRA